MRTHSSSHVSSQYLYDHDRGLLSDLCLHRLQLDRVIGVASRVVYKGARAGDVQA
jgi:hypothetical protein